MKLNVLLRNPAITAVLLMISTVQLASAGPYTGGPLISEFVASNSTGLSDQFARKEDWIEIHNPTSAAISLENWYLTDTATNLIKWQFPAVTLAPGAYLVVFASDRNLRDPANPMHTNFKLSATGEYLALVQPDGVTVAFDYAPVFPTQLSDVSYGAKLVADGEGGFVANESYYTVPTPGAANSTSTLGVLQDVGFSANRGFFTTSFSLQLTHTNSQAQIRYTLDGSAPTATTGLIYTQPIAISTTATVRAAAFLSGFTTLRPETRTYLRVADIINQPASISGWPQPSISVGSGSRTHDYGMDSSIVNAPAYNSDLIAGMTSIPTISLVVKKSDMWDSSGNGGFYRGVDVKSAASVEYINPQDPTENVQGDCSVEGHSHDRMKRSLRLSFSSAYGETNFDSKIFTGGPFLGYAGNRQVDKIVLRAGNNRSFARSWNPQRSTYTEDEWYRSTQIEMGNVGSPGRFVHLFINGLYWGLYNALERPDADFAASQMGGSDEDWFSVSHGGVASGTSTRWDYLVGALTAKNMSVTANYEELKGYVDVSGLIDYVLCGFYMGLNDWPGNNWWGGNRNTPAGPFQFFSWDGEWSWGVGNSSNLTAWVHPSFRSTASSTAPAARIWNAAKSNPEFLMLMADRLNKHLSPGGALDTTRAVARWDNLNEHIRLPIVAESARWGDVMQTPPSRRDVEWIGEVTRIRNLMRSGNINGTGTNNNGQILKTAMRNESYYPQIEPPVLSQYGGTIPANFQLVLTNPNSNSVIYYTLNGTDPRLPGGTLSPSAILYTGPINIPFSLTVETRVLRTSTWSALQENSFTSPSAPPLRVTEIMYNPSNPSPAEITAGFTEKEAFEYLEFTNVGTTPLDLTGANFTKGLTFTFGQKVLQPGGIILLASNAQAFAQRYGSIPLDGVYTGNLENSGEQLRLRSASSEILFDITYDGTWYPEANNGDKSLVIRNVNGALTEWNVATGWRTSSQTSGSPGVADPAPSAYESWRLTLFTPPELANSSISSISSADADADDDGTPNLAEFVYGTDPRVPQKNVATATPTRGRPNIFPAQPVDNWRVVYARRKSAQLTGVSVRPQFATKLDDWSDTVASPIVLADDGDIEILALPFPAGNPPKRFFRLLIKRE